MLSNCSFQHVFFVPIPLSKSCFHLFVLGLHKSCNHLYDYINPAQSITLNLLSKALRHDHDHDHGDHGIIA